MFRGLYTGWTGMVNEQKRLDVISHNMANADSVGYKDERVSSQAFEQVLGIKIRDGSQAYHNEAIGHLSLGVKVGEVYTDYSQGSIRGTGGTYDLALSGSGFFTVNVVDKKGDTHKKVSISPTGVVSADGTVVDSLKIVDFEDYDYLKKYGDTMVEPVDGATTKDADAQILQGYTEQSNVNVIKEMVDMITITRAYEANQKVIRSYDSMLDSAVNQVGRLG